uniref:protein CDV3 homolog n=1 Tax=Ciona intestinalis TaxID=7719 RepID=UPI000180BE14|nr:protein CDV3 homolog [Ciona intestinalis]|eukprot:XP_002128805.1 protein CDV3 homolog [Ciona intestinalis]
MADDDIETNPVAVPEEDDSLDSFFKKKDKKGKKKKKSKKVESEEIGEKLKKKEPESESEVKEVTGTQPVEQEEWIDFEDESQRDYSDLKIQNLQIVETEETVPVDVPEYNEAGELLPPKQEEGPWNKNQPSAIEVIQKPAEPEPSKEEAPKVGVYRPPKARLSSSGTTPLRRSRKQQAPEINNEMQFPSLAAAAQDNVPHEGFEVVKTGVKSSTPWRGRHQTQSADIKLGNQFSALNAGH